MPKGQRTANPVLEEALKRFQLAEEAEDSWREKCLDDLKFSTGDQWDQNIKDQRIKNKKPCLTMDQIQQSVKITCNEYRQNAPALQVNPIGSGSDQDTAEVLQGIIRHIEVNSDASQAYEWAHECVVRTGIGHWRLLNEYADDDTDDQEIIIEKVRNQFTVYWQPGVPQEKAKWAFVVEDVPTDTYQAENSDDYGSPAEFAGIGNDSPSWVTKEYIRVAEYFTIEEKERKGKRPKKTVKWRKINCLNIMDERDLPGTSIPIFTAYGDDIDIDGERYLAGMIRNAKGPQQQYNYMCSAATQAVALAPTAPWVMAEGQAAGREKEWQNANSGELQALFYKQTDVGGKPAPPPQRNTVEPPIQAISQLLAQASMDLKSATGVYDPSLGQRKGDESGKAIEKLQQQGNTATLNYSDNVARTLRRFGKVVLEWIPEIYDTARVQRIINPDGSAKQVIIHQDDPEAAKELQAENEAIKNIYDLSTGKYDVTVSVGPSYQTKRQEAVATQMELLKVIPPQMSMNILDLVVRNTDIPQSKEIADRLKKMLPPQLQDQDEGDPEQKVQKLEQTLSQMSQQHELLTKALGEAQKVIETKQVEQQGKLQIAQLQEQSAQSIEKFKGEVQIAIAEINTKAQETQARLKIESDTFTKFGIKHADLQDSRESRAHDAGLQAGDQAHEQKLAAQGHLMDAAGQAQEQQGDAQAQASDQAADAGAQQSDQAHEMTMTAVGQEHEHKMAKEGQSHEKHMAKDSMTHEQKMAKEAAKNKPKKEK